MTLQTSLQQWLVSINDTQLSSANQIFDDTIQLLSSRSDVKVERIIGAETLPRVAVIHASTDTVAELQSILDNRTVISLDKPLQQFNNS